MKPSSGRLRVKAEKAYRRKNAASHRTTNSPLKRGVRAVRVWLPRTGVSPATAVWLQKPGAKVVRRVAAAVTRHRRAAAPPNLPNIVKADRPNITADGAARNGRMRTASNPQYALVT